MFSRESASDKEVKEAVDKSKEINFKSRFHFLMAVNGLRQGSLNGFLGTTGSGKSTLLKTIIADTIKNCSCLVWLSEESTSEYQAKINTIVEDYSHLKNLRFVEEREIDNWYLKRQKVFFQMFEELIKDEIEEFNTKVIFIDNLTSSYFYNEDITISQQGKSAKFLSRLAKNLNVAIVYVAHTKKSVNDVYGGLITKEDIRGSQQISIVSEYLYILQNFRRGKEVFPIVQISKHRFHEVEDKFHILHFERGNYQHDKSLDFLTVKEIFTSRDRL
jgi:archaellum biogenesis ATPase FlaH